MLNLRLETNYEKKKEREREIGRDEEKLVPNVTIGRTRLKTTKRGSLQRGGDEEKRTEAATFVG